MIYKGYIVFPFRNYFKITDMDGKFIANVDETGYGLLQISTDRLRSRKLFSWGNQEASNHWQEYLTDKAGRYLEVQAGLAKTQYGCIPMAPHTAWEWMEQYGMNDWNGECFDIDNGLSLYPVYTEPNENDQSFIGHYEIR